MFRLIITFFALITLTASTLYAQETPVVNAAAKVEKAVAQSANMQLVNDEGYGEDDEEYYESEDQENLPTDEDLQDLEDANEEMDYDELLNEELNDEEVENMLDDDAVGQESTNQITNNQ